MARLIIMTALVVTSATAWITPEDTQSDSNCTNNCASQYSTVCTSQGNFVFHKDKAKWATKQFKTNGKIIYTLKGSNE